MMHDQSTGAWELQTESKQRMSAFANLTTSNGNPVIDNANSLTVGPRGPMY